MKLKIKRDYFNRCPISGYYLTGGIDEDIIYEIDDEFMRDLRIELSTGDQTNYTTLLIRLIFKACSDNWNKLSKIYPAECLTIWAYQNIPDFYKQIIN